MLVANIEVSNEVTVLKTIVDVVFPEFNSSSAYIFAKTFTCDLGYVS